MTDISTTTDTTPPFPPVLPEVAQAATEALTTRLRKRLDQAVARLAADPPTPIRTSETEIRIDLGPEATVTLLLTDGAVRTPEDARCTCLLAPNCLHRAAVLAVAPAPQTPSPTASPTAPTPETPASDAPTSHQPTPHQPDLTPTPTQQAAARTLWNAAAALLAAGAAAAGNIVQAELLRAAHSARAAGLHRSSAAALRTVNQIRQLRSGSPQFRLRDLTADLTDLLLTTHLLAHPAKPTHPTNPTNTNTNTNTSEPQYLPQLLGTARRVYTPIGSLRLHGLCAQPVITTSGHAGVVVHAMAADGTLRSVSDIAPGGPTRVPQAAAATVPIGRAALTLHELARSGLLISNATESPDGRIGNSKNTRAVRAATPGWNEPPVAARWQEPLHHQVARALATHQLPQEQRPSGYDLLFFYGTVLGTRADALLLTPEPTLESTPEPTTPFITPTPINLTAPHAHPSLLYTDNLRVLGSTPGLSLSAIATLDPDRPRTARLITVQLAAAPAPVDLGLTRVHPPSPRALTTLPSPLAQSPQLTATPVTPAPATPASPFHPLERAVQRGVTGGRAAITARHSRTPSLPSGSLAIPLPTTGALLAHLAATASERHQDPFGRLVPTAHDDYARAWLAASVHLRAATAELTAASWN